MSAKAAVEPAFATSFDPASPSARAWQPKITRVVPWVRWAILVRHQPPLTDWVADRAKVLLEDAWSSWSGKLRKKVASLTRLSAANLSFRKDESIRLKYDGKTPMIDLPLMETDVSVGGFSLRICVALCTDDYSSKVWARVGSPAVTPYGCRVSEVRETVSFYRDLARQTSDWFHDEFFALTASAFVDHQQHRIRTMELDLTTLALHLADTPTADHLEAWLYHQDSAPNLANAQLRRFIADALGVEADADYLNQKEAFWVSMPASGQLDTGELASRNFIYFVRPTAGALQVAGVGLDDTREGELASAVALKMSTYIASRV